MSFMDVLGYTFDSDTWCEECLREHLKLRGFRPKKIEKLLQDGSEVGVVFEGQGDDSWDEGLYCNACYKELIENPHNFTVFLGEKTAVIRVEIKRGVEEEKEISGTMREVRQVTLSHSDNSDLNASPLELYLLGLDKRADTQDVVSHLRDIIYNGSTEEGTKLLTEEYEDWGDFCQVLGEWLYQKNIRTSLIAFFDDNEDWLEYV